MPRLTSIMWFFRFPSLFSKGHQWGAGSIRPCFRKISVLTVLCANVGQNYTGGYRRGYIWDIERVVLALNRKKERIIFFICSDVIRVRLIVSAHGPNRSGYHYGVLGREVTEKDNSENIWRDHSSTVCCILSEQNLCNRKYDAVRKSHSELRHFVQQMRGRNFPKPSIHHGTLVSNVHEISDHLSSTEGNETDLKRQTRTWTRPKNEATGTYSNDEGLSRVKQPIILLTHWPWSARLITKS